MNKNRFWFFILLLYFTVEYGRPQDILNIGFLRPGLVTILILILLVIINKGFFLHVAQIKYMLIFISILAFLVPLAVNNFWAYQVFQGMFLLLPPILSILFLITNTERLKIFLYFILSLVIFVSLWAIFHNGQGPGHFFADENDLSLFINMWLPFFYFMIFVEKGIVKKIFLIVGLIIGLTAIVVSFSRGGFVGLLAISVIAWLVSPKKIVTLVIIIMIVLGLFLFVEQSYWTEMSTITDTKESTATARIESWKAAWNMFLDRPWGIGGKNFEVIFDHYKTDYFYRHMWGRVAHSLWFTLIPETGVLGVIIYLILLFVNIRDGFYLKNIGELYNLKLMYYLAFAYLASIAGFFASATFLSVLYYPHYWYLCALIAATVQIANDIILEENNPYLEENSEPDN